MFIEILIIFIITDEDGSKPTVFLVGVKLLLILYIYIYY